VEFKAFQEKKHKRTIMIIAGISTFVLLVGIIIYQSYAMYEQINEYDVNKIRNYIQKDNKSKFPYLSGNKICNYWFILCSF